MKSLKFFIAVLPLLIALLITISSAQQPKNAEKDNTTTTKDSQEIETIDSYKGSSPFLNSKKRNNNKYRYYNPYKSWRNAARARITCDRLPRVCRLKGSPGRDCCGRKCVDVRSDRLNCGFCGRRCRYPEVCCKGRCVNPWYDRRNCGGCHKKCKKGTFCYYGMCSYA